MSFSRARDLIRLAQMAAARRVGVSLEEIGADFGVSHRTAKHMTVALAETFGNAGAADGEDCKRRWRLVDPALSQAQLRAESGVEALAIADHAARLRRPAGPRRGGRGDLAPGPRGRRGGRGLALPPRPRDRAATLRQPDPAVPRGREGR
jgi:hypothetical protein